jgi:hypothetical protein
VCVLHKKGKKVPGNATYASVKKELAKPRMSKSARITELNLDTARISAHKYHHARMRRQNHPAKDVKPHN